MAPTCSRPLAPQPSQAHERGRCELDRPSSDQLKAPPRHGRRVSQPSSHRGSAPGCSSPRTGPRFTLRLEGISNRLRRGHGGPSELAGTGVGSPLHAAGAIRGYPSRPSGAGEGEKKGSRLSRPCHSRNAATGGACRSGCRGRRPTPLDLTHRRHRHKSCIAPSAPLGRPRREVRSSASTVCGRPVDCAPHRPRTRLNLARSVRSRLAST